MAHTKNWCPVRPGVAQGGTTFHNVPHGEVYTQVGVFEVFNWHKIPRNGLSSGPKLGLWFC